MLYQIAMFWDGSHSDSRAVAESCGESTHWVTVNGKDAAKTTIFVQNANDAADLAELINKLTARPLDPRKIDYRIKSTPTPRRFVRAFIPKARLALRSRTA